MKLANANRDLSALEIVPVTYNIAAKATEIGD